MEKYDVPILFIYGKDSNITYGSTSRISDVMDTSEFKKLYELFSEMAFANNEVDEAIDQATEKDLDQVLLSMDMGHMRKHVGNWARFIPSKTFDTSNPSRPTHVLLILNNFTNISQAGKRVYKMDVWQRQYLKEVVLEAKNPENPDDLEGTRDVLLALCR